MGKTIRLGLLMAAATTILAAGCTVHQATAPSLTGPSELALSLNLTATPDSLSLDGSASAVVVEAHHPDGSAWVGVPLRLDIQVGPTAQDCGTLSSRNVVTGTDGRATAIYTAPGLPLPFPQCTGFTPGQSVTIIATPSGSNFQASNSRSASIRLMPTGVILPPAGSPKAAFVVSPAPPMSVNVSATFDASTSCPAVDANGACAAQSGGSIARYAWTFGDGSSASGVTAPHTYSAAGTFSVTLTVTNDRGVSASTTQQVSAVAPAVPTAGFVFSPTAPGVGQTVVFNASSATAAPGHTITQFSWIFGDGGTASGLLTSHIFNSTGTFNVTLSVLDDAGQRTTSSQGVTVSNSGGGASATAALFTVTPSPPVALQLTFFNAATSTAATGRTLVTYDWNFGDGTLLSTATSSTTHTFAAAGVFPVTLSVTDDAGQKGTVTTAVTVAAAGAGDLKAEFNFSPTDPRSGQLVSFNGNLSSPQGTITSYDWDFGDGTVVNGQSSFLIAHTYFTFTGNVFTVRLTVHDNTGRVATIPHTVTVIAGGPAVPTFTVSPSPATLATQPVTVQITSATTVSANWSFGDGTAVVTTSGAINTTTTHSYTATGSYVITLTVIDSFGQTNSTTRTLVVQ